MSNSIQADTWVWIIIKDPAGNEEIVGQEDRESGVAFIPAFLSKEDALQCMNLLARERGVKHEPQAIMADDLSQRAADNGFVVFILNEDGDVQEKLSV